MSYSLASLKVVLWGLDREHFRARGILGVQTLAHITTINPNCRGQGWLENPLLNSGLRDFKDSAKISGIGPARRCSPQLHLRKFVTNPLETVANPQREATWDPLVRTLTSVARVRQVLMGIWGP